jgi:hypothetical protein
VEQADQAAAVLVLADKAAQEQVALQVMERPTQVLVAAAVRRIVVTIFVMAAQVVLEL